MLYPSWIEIPATDLDRAVAFYRSVFEIEEVTLHQFDEGGESMHVALLLASDKGSARPGVSLVKSPRHQPCAGGPQVNFHVGTPADLLRAIRAVIAAGGLVVRQAVEMSDDVSYAVVRDSEGNTIALSAFEEIT